MKDELAQQLDKLEKIKDRLNDDIQPLNELGEREVQKPEVEAIYKKMQNLKSELQTFQYQIKPLAGRSVHLQKEFGTMLLAERSNKMSQTDNKLSKLDRLLSEIERAA